VCTRIVQTIVCVLVKELLKSVPSVLRYSCQQNPLLIGRRRRSHVDRKTLPATAFCQPPNSRDLTSGSRKQTDERHSVVESVLFTFKRLQLLGFISETSI
jgi:hypothetical protein